MSWFYVCCECGALFEQDEREGPDTEGCGVCGCFALIESRERSTATEQSTHLSRAWRMREGIELSTAGHPYRSQIKRDFSEVSR